MSDASRILAAILLIAVPTVEFGGLALLGVLTRRTAGYLDNPLRQNMFRAGHAHAGVWLVFALVALLWVDQTDLGEPWKWIVRIAFVAAPILMPLGFFLSVTRPDAQRPNGVIGLVYVAGLALGVGAVTLGLVCSSLGRHMLTTQGPGQLSRLSSTAACFKASRSQAQGLEVAEPSVNPAQIDEGVAQEKRRLHHAGTLEAFFECGIASAYRWCSSLADSEAG